MKKYYDSMGRFSKIDGDKYLGCSKQVISNDECLEWRQTVNGEMHIIQYYPNGKGYQIYVPENQNNDSIGKTDLEDLVNAMERWHLGRSEDSEVIDALNDALVKIGRLSFFNKKEK